MDLVMVRPQLCSTPSQNPEQLLPSLFCLALTAQTGLVQACAVPSQAATECPSLVRQGAYPAGLHRRMRIMTTMRATWTTMMEETGRAYSEAHARSAAHPTTVRS